MNTDLSVRDIKFLRAVRDINANPEAYEKTDRGVVPANKTSITEATDLGKKEVSYRLGGNHSRGFEDGDEALIEAHGPQINQESNRFGPRSAELTQHGVQLLSEFEESGYMGGGEREDEPETIKQLRARLDALEGDGVGAIEGQSNGELGGRVDEIEADLDSLESAVSSLRASVGSIEQSEWGGVDESHHTNLSKTVNRLPPMFYLLSEVFELDVDRVAEEAPYDEATLAEIRESVVETLGLDTSNPEGEDGGVSEGVDTPEDSGVSSESGGRGGKKEHEPPSFAEDL